MEQERELARLRLQVAEQASLESERARLDGMQTFYHGTSLEAGLAIQKRGFRIDLSGSNAGRMLGDGVYLTTTLEKALNYAKVKPHGGCVLELKVDLGRCKELARRDPMMQTWHQHSYDSAHSGDGINGEREEHCVRDPSRVTVVDVVLNNTGKAAKAGYVVRGGKLLLDPDIQQSIVVQHAGGDGAGRAAQQRTTHQPLSPAAALNSPLLSANGSGSPAQLTGVVTRGSGHVQGRSRFGTVDNLDDPLECTVECWSACFRMLVMMFVGVPTLLGVGGLVICYLFGITCT
jgi:hypothetical protein